MLEVGRVLIICQSSKSYSQGDYPDRFDFVESGGLDGIVVGTCCRRRNLRFAGTFDELDEDVGCLYPFAGDRANVVVGGGFDEGELDGSIGIASGEQS